MGNHLIWIDLEMTGLEPERDYIIEVGIVVTNCHLDVVAEAPVYAIHQSDEVLGLMDAWNVKTHTKSGLVERVSNLFPQAQVTSTLWYLGCIFSFISASLFGHIPSGRA